MTNEPTTTHQPGNGFLTAAEAAECWKALGICPERVCNDLRPHDPHASCPGKTFPGSPPSVVEAGRSMDEYDTLDSEQRGYYDEAVSCGASHNDAMEAATTYGYTR